MGLIGSLLRRVARAQREVRSVGEEGFVDLDLPLVDFAEPASGGFRIAARGSFGGEIIGFAATVEPEWKAKPIEEGRDHFFYWGAVTLRSIGAPSDSFVSALAQLYGDPISKPKMLATIPTEAVGLATDPRALRSSPVKMKLFFHSDAQPRYAELFLNIDRTGGVVQVHEKDPEYRSNVVRAFVEP
jgi:hypothetical protein